jgi:hypothetical protein
LKTYNNYYLYVACLGRNGRIVKLLINAGIDVTIKDEAGETALLKGFFQEKILILNK